MIFLIILIGYAALMIALGLFTARGVRKSGDFFVAGRGLGSSLIFSTLLAANIGAGSTVGATGLGYRYGLSAWWWVGSAGIGSVILALTVGPKIWESAKAHDLYTVGDYLERRYDRIVRGLVALLLWLGSLSILAGQLMAVAWILNVTLDLNKPLGCLLASIVTTIYFAAGGLHSTARVNVLQVILKLAGFAGAFVYFLQSSGGWSGILGSVQSTPANLDPQDYVSFVGIGPGAILSYFCILAPSFLVSPGILQKLFGAKSVSAVRWGVLLNAFALLVFAVVPAIMGVLARTSFPDLPQPELALPMLLTRSLPISLGGLLLGAIFSAELSAADAVLFMLTTSLTRDLLQPYLRPNMSDSQMVRLTRSTAIVCGGLGAFLAVLLPSVISALTVFYTLLTAGLLLPLIAGLYLPTVNGRTATVGILTSVFATLACDLLPELTRGVPSIVVGVALGALSMSIDHRVRRRRT